MAAAKKDDPKTVVTLEHGGVIYPVGTPKSDIDNAEAITAEGVFED